MSASVPPPFSMPIAASTEALPATLPAVLESLWARIATGLDGSWLPWALPTVVTVAEDGAPRARVLALRAVDAHRRRFTFHADARSDKMRDIAGDSRVSLLFFDRDDAVQARFDGNAAVHHADPEAAAAWRNVSALRRSACAVELEPGEPLDAPERFDRLPAMSDVDAAFTNFVLIVVEVSAIDWLWLGPHDMRRARFAWTGSRWSGSWIVP